MFHPSLTIVIPSTISFQPALLIVFKSSRMPWLEYGCAVCQALPSHFFNSPSSTAQLVTYQAANWLQNSFSYTFKTLLVNQQPSYLAELLITETPSRSLRSFSQHKHKNPFIKSKQGERAFAYAAPTIWHSLPAHLRTCTSITTFHALLKTHFFSSVVIECYLDWFFWLMVCMCLTLLGSLIWLNCVGGIVLLVLAAKASLTLSFDCEMDDKPWLIDWLIDRSIDWLIDWLIDIYRSHVMKSITDSEYWLFSYLRYLYIIQLILYGCSYVDSIVSCYLFIFIF